MAHIVMLDGGSADRWIVREGWYFLNWTVNRKMVQHHSRLGSWIVGLGIVTAPLLAIVDVAAGIGGALGIVTAGAVHLGFKRWADNHHEVRDEGPPPISSRARKLLKRLTVAVAGTDPFGQKYYLKYVRQSAPKALKSTQDVLPEPAFSAFESLTRAYNGAIAAVAGLESRDVNRALQESMAEGLDWVAQIAEFPERLERPVAALDRLVLAMQQLEKSVDQLDSAKESEVRVKLTAWSEALRRDAEPETRLEVRE